jgi:RHS repeat-associated protein
VQRTPSSARPVREIAYTYDAGGNRISKTVFYSNRNPDYTWYVRDATGNVMAIYEQGSKFGDSTKMWATEYSLYGSSRLGVWRRMVNVDSVATLVGRTAAGALTANTLNLNNGIVSQLVPVLRGEVSYELSNHLGNVLSTISDQKVGVAAVGNSSLIGYYKAVVQTANDYYPFGMMMPGRNYNAAGSKDYTYGFNGKMNDNDVKGIEGSQQDYGMRIYDPRLGRFLSVDPLAREYPWNSVYAFAENDPINYIDLDGGEKPPTTAQGTPYAPLPVLKPVVDQTLKKIAQEIAEEAAKNGGSQVVRKVAEKAGTSIGSKIWGGVKWIGGRALGVVVFVLMPLPAGEGSYRPYNFQKPQPAPQPAPQPQFDPRKAPEPTEDGDEGYYIYEARRSHKKEAEIVDKANIPYFGITKNALIASPGVNGRYSADSEEGSTGQILGKTNYYTAKGVETALILLNTKGYSSVLASTRVDNKMLSTRDKARLISGILWLRANYGDNWKDAFLRNKNPEGAKNPDNKTP